MTQLSLLTAIYAIYCDVLVDMYKIMFVFFKIKQEHN